MVHVSAVQAACWWSSPCFVGDLGALKLPWKGPSPVTLWVRSACWQHRHRADCEVRCSNVHDSSFEAFRIQCHVCRIL
jgi:hypothetical protein